MMRTLQAISHLDGVARYPTPEQAVVLGVLGLRNPPSAEVSADQYFSTSCKRVLKLPVCGRSLCAEHDLRRRRCPVCQRMVRVFGPDEVA